MSKNDFPDLIQDLLYAQEHSLLNDAVGVAAKQAVEAGVADDFIVGLVREPVRKHKISQAFAGPYRMPKLNHGDFVIGSDLKGRPIRVPVQYLNGHSLTAGGSGSGKTIGARNRILHIASKVTGMWLFDFRKREFGVLGPHLAHLGVDLLIVPGRKLALNPLQVSLHVDPADFAPRVADMLVLVLNLPPRASKLLHLTILKLYRTFGVFDGGRSYPTLFDLREAIAVDSTANPQAKLAVMDGLDPVLMSLGSETLGYSLGWPTGELAKRHIVFDLSGLSETDKNLILNSLILPEFSSRVARGISNPQMDLFICCDEAARLLSASNSSGGISDLIGLVRGTGVGLDLSVQSTDIVPAVLSNTANKFLGRCGSAKDYDTIGAAMGLTVEQRQWARLHLRPGLFIGQVGDGDWRHPFVFQQPLLRLPTIGKNSADAVHLGDLTQLPVERTSIAHTPPQTGASVSASSPTAQSGSEVLSEADVRYLRTVIEHPALPSSAYPKLVGMGTRRTQQIRCRLVDLGYLREHNVNTGTKGRASIVLEPLKVAFQVVGKVSPSHQGQES